MRAGTKATPSAEILLRLENGEEKSAHATGTGPVDAAFHAIEEICGKKGELTEFRMDAVTAGLDAQAVVSLTLRTPDGRKFFGRAGNTDVVIASALAYLDAIEKCLRRREKISEKEGV